MRRILSALICLVLIFSLSACGAQKSLTLTPFREDVSFDMGDITVRGTLNFEETDSITFTVKEPDYVSGVVFSGDEIWVEDVKTIYDKAEDSSPVKMLIDVVADISQREISVPLKGEFEYSGEISSAEYKIIFDCENDRIISIEAGKFAYNFE